MGSLLKQVPVIPSGHHRIFIGIACDQRAQRQINEVLLPVRNLSPYIRWEAETNRHLTLAFLGNITTSSLEDLLGLFDKSYSHLEQFQISLTRLVRFPDEQGRIIALITEPDPALAFLYKTTVELLQSSSLDLLRKEFRPHITLGRISRVKQVTDIIDYPTAIDLGIRSIRLYQSTLGESGSVYTVLKETPLGS